MIPASEGLKQNMLDHLNPYPKSIKNTVLSFLFIGVLLFLPALKGNSQKIPKINNPVLPGVADAGVIRFNGEYYIGGVFTNGSFYTSKDLVHWEGPVHVFSMDNEWTNGPSADDSQIHANDINYVNGVFHQYWSVNYWGKDQHVVHIGHATAHDVLGPYKEPVKDNWLDNRIDPHLFVDDDGKPYLYMVKFTDGNTIWTRPMKDPWTFSGDPIYLFASLPKTWETSDNRVAEGPWVIRYRNRYYLMYNTNHTSTRWGNYALGVAEASTPMGFNHGSKYPHPVVQTNQLELEDEYVDLLKYSARDQDTFWYTTKQPDKDWKNLYYDASSWQKGKAGFGSEVIENSTSRQVETVWKTPHIWLRKTFVLEEENKGNLMLRIHHDGETKLFLNGHLIYEEKDREYVTWNFDKKATALLRDGENVLAIHSTEGRQSHFLDVSLFDMKDQQGDDILYSPGQPNILRGPNGFEWWLIYMANKNRERRGQFINRVHFFDKKLSVDGITSSNTPGYHPVPALPTFSDLFEETDYNQWKSRWDVRGGNWSLKNKELVQPGPSIAQAFLKAPQAAHYLFETGIKIGDTVTAKAGIYAWWKDEEHWLKLILDPQERKWAYTVKEDGESKTYAFPLPADFNYQVFHTLRVYKNADQFTIQIDGLPAPEKSVVEVAGFSGPGIPGLYAEGASTAFDGVLYTIGWDEFDEHINGWESATQDSEWLVSEKGISQTRVAGEHAAFKGDTLQEYEVSLQITWEDSIGSAGIYPIYIDEHNYVKATFSFQNQKFIISGKSKGKIIDAQEVSLEGYHTYYADMKYSDFIEKHFSFDTPTYINGLKLNKVPHLQPDTVIDDIHQKVNIFYKQQGSWHPVRTYQDGSSLHPGFNEITFEPVRAEGLKFVNKRADDHHFYLYKIGVNELFRQSYHLRVVRLKNKVLFLVDGKEVFQLIDDFPASQVGLFTKNTKASFNGITLFHLGK